MAGLERVGTPPWPSHHPPDLLLMVMWWSDGVDAVMLLPGRSELVRIPLPLPQASHPPAPPASLLHPTVRHVSRSLRYQSFKSY